MFLTWIGSWIAGRWLPLLVLAGCVAGLATAYGYGRSHANTRWEARWEAAEQAARVAAAVATARQNERLLAANGALKDEQAKVAALDYALGVSVDSLRQYATRPRNLPQPADYPRCVAELATERDRAGALGDLLVEGSALARDLARERDDAVARLWAAADAWPR
jgi:hypothetical protein